ncbi:MAG: 3,4-dihydroxy-2-butanone-4-phosphate synthase [Geminicoccaceae bacterium]|nr:MAG: 3,4-dihydroxy-2-butanone-4-phosphate synthase [Geminicoccaceae bacterium]
MGLAADPAADAQPSHCRALVNGGDRARHWPSARRSPTCSGRSAAGGGDEKGSMSQLDSIEDAIAAMARGEMVIVVDDDDRENEGDLIVAADRATPEQMAFMIRHTSGIICVPLSAADARRLRLDPMVSANDAPMGTAFTVSVDYRHGLTTGISAEERTATVRALANRNAGAEDFVRPGHIFPLVAKDGGVLIRSGHTEAAVDLARLAGSAPVGVIGELVNDDGSVKRLRQCQAFAQQHGLKIVSIADLIDYRQRREHLVQRITAFEVTTAAGPAQAVVYQTPFDSLQQLALVFGDVLSEAPVLARIHRERVVADLFTAELAGGPARRALTRIAKEGRGVLVYLRDGLAVPPQDWPAEGSADDDSHGSAAARRARWREVGVGAQILRDLGVQRIRLLTTSQRQYVGLGGFGIEIVANEPIEG